VAWCFSLQKDSNQSQLARKAEFTHLQGLQTVNDSLFPFSPHSKKWLMSCAVLREPLSCEGNEGGGDGQMTVMGKGSPGAAWGLETWQET
jgi:hypothetical protein